MSHECQHLLLAPSHRSPLPPPLPTPLSLSLSRARTLSLSPVFSHEREHLLLGRPALPHSIQGHTTGAVFTDPPNDTVDALGEVVGEGRERDFGAIEPRGILRYTSVSRSLLSVTGLFYTALLACVPAR